jgi:hypothetical protein
MDDRVRLVLSAAFYFSALAARLSGFANIEAASGFAMIATALLVHTAFHHMQASRQGQSRQQARVRTWHLVIVAIAGT